MSPHFVQDPALRDILDLYSLTETDLLGGGGEARVYALGEDRVIRVLHQAGDPESLRTRAALVNELRAGGAPFALPETLETGEHHGRSFAIEKRQPGRSVMAMLHELEGPDRQRLVENHLDAAAALRSVGLAPRPWFGELIRSDPIRTRTWHEYLDARARRSLAGAPPTFREIDPSALADALPDCADGSFVHLDAFAGNMLAVGSKISAVIDFGETSIVGDPDLDAVSAAVYLDAAQITPPATPADREVAASWLRNRGLEDRFEPTRRWLAAFWSWAVDDLALHAWCREVLLG